ncbi:MAG: hypothetical protein SV186_01710, partial [Candidatus Nanohaloarchaea archaeon]|nr:hypothetical protein [Candidatus Nanohaloarchaea archaeon]
MNRKGVSPLISYAIYAGIGIAAIVIVIQTGLPAINNMRDTTAIQQAIRDLSSMEEQINAIARQGEGAQTTQRLRLSRGQLHIENESIVYTITTGSGIISAGSKRRFGSIILSANAQASLTNATYNGTDCYLLQNQYIEACIRKYGSPTTFEQGDIGDALLYMEHKEANRTITPSL